MLFVEQASLRKPTPAELQILEVLWDRGASTVRQVHGVLTVAQGTGHTTVLKLLQIMHQKGLVLRDESRRSHVYTPAVSRARTRGQLVRDLMERAFSGSATELVASALGEKPASKKELAALRALIDEMENGS